MTGSASCSANWWKSATSYAGIMFSTGALKNFACQSTRDSVAAEPALDAAEELRQLFKSQPVGAVDLESLEFAVKHLVMNLGAAIVSSWISSHASDGEPSQIGCAGAARRAGRRGKQLTSALGELRLQRTYYHCDSCDTGFFPKDLELGIQGKSVSDAVQRMIGRVSREASFASTRELSRPFSQFQQSKIPASPCHFELIVPN